MAAVSLLGALLLLLLIGPYLVPLPDTGAGSPQALARPGGEFVQLPYSGTGGIDFYFERDAYSGNDAPRTFVLLHGFAANLTTWDDIRPWLASRGDVYSYDRVPFGLSERLLRDDWQGSSPYSDEAAVEQLLGLLDAWGIERATLIGNSAGGTIAMMMALQHPDRVDSLALLSPAVYSGSRRPLGILAAIPPLRRWGLLLSRRVATGGALLELAYHDPSRITEERRRNAALIARVANWDKAFWEYVRSARSPAALRGQLGQLAQPSLLLTGDDDRVIPTADTLRLATELPDSSLHVLPECGHLPQEECPAAVIAALQAWLDGY